MFTTATARPEDIPALLQLINSAYRGEPSRKGWTTEADFLAGDIRTDAENLAELMARPGAVFLKVFDAAGTIGGCVFLEKHEAQRYLCMLSVGPELQGNGIGKILLKGAEDQARKMACKSIYMQVISLRDELIDWYLRHGYQRTGERRPFISPEKFGVPTRPLEFVVLERYL